MGWKIYANKKFAKITVVYFWCWRSYLLFLIIFFLTLDSSAQSPDIKPVLSTSTESGVVKEQINSKTPFRLKIPKIKLNIPVEQVGLTPQGAVGVPKGRANAAWFNLGSRPGDIGSAVITGHFGRWRDGVSGVFNNLYKLRKGDKIYIQDEKGVLITFVVRESRSYKPDASVPEIFNLDDERSHLNLITCEGVWNKATQTYSKRLVIFADRE